MTRRSAYAVLAAALAALCLLPAPVSAATLSEYRWRVSRGRWTWSGNADRLQASLDLASVLINYQLCRSTPGNVRLFHRAADGQEKWNWAAATALADVVEADSKIQVAERTT